MSAWVEVTQPLSYGVTELRADVRPLRAAFEMLALTVRNEWLNQGMAEPALEAALDLRYEGQENVVTVPFLLEVEDAGVCLADPRPLDAQALRTAVTQFQGAYAAQYGDASPHGVVQVVMLRVRAQSAQT